MAYCDRSRKILGAVTIFLMVVLCLFILIAGPVVEDDGVVIICVAFLLTWLLVHCAIGFLWAAEEKTVDVDV